MKEKKIDMGNMGDLNKEMVFLVKYQRVMFTNLTKLYIRQGLKLMGLRKQNSLTSKLFVN